jgi:hypothetical protein
MSFEIGYSLGFRHAVDMMRWMGRQDYYDSWESMLEDCEKVMPQDLGVKESGKKSEDV